MRLPVAAAALVATGSALTFDVSATPATCRAICRPITTLVTQCRDKVDASASSSSSSSSSSTSTATSDGNSGSNSGQLQAQCVCTNDSFGVESKASECQGCIAGCLSFPDKLSTRDEHTAARDKIKAALEEIDGLIQMCGFDANNYVTASATATGITVEATAPASLTTTYSTIPTALQRKHNTTDDTGDDDDDDSGSVAAAPFWLAGALVAGAMMMA